MLERNLYVNELNDKQQGLVKNMLVEALSEIQATHLAQGSLELAIEQAMNSRLSDLSDTIDLQELESII